MTRQHKKHAGASYRRGAAYYRIASERRADIAGALASLLSAHRLRLIGVKIVQSGYRHGFDSWATK